MKHFMTREYMLTEASEEEWKQFDVNDPFDTQVMKDFAIDNPEDKDHLWNTLVRPLIEVDNELDELFNNTAIEFLNLCRDSQGDEILPYSIEAARAACRVYTNGRFGKLSSFSDRARAMASWNEVSRLISALYQATKNMLIVFKDKTAVEMFLDNPTKLKEAAEKAQRILNNYRQTKFRKIVKTDKTSQDALAKVMSRLNDNEIRGVLDIRGRNALRLTQDWIDGKLPEGRKKLLLDLLQRLQSGLSTRQDNQSRRTVRDLKFVHDFVSAN